jgi:hypothetical protein
MSLTRYGGRSRSSAAAPPSRLREAYMVLQHLLTADNGTWRTSRNARLISATAAYSRADFNVIRAGVNWRF